MELTIKKNEGGDIIVVSFGKTSLEIWEGSPKWNTDGINEFLINLASQTPNNENITISFDKDEESKIYKHIVDLFREFTNEFNNLNVTKD